MSQSPFTREHLDRLRAAAREKARTDHSRSYLQWLDQLCSVHGFTYTSLKARIKELEVAQLEAIEADIWRSRLEAARVWGAPPDKAEHTLRIPIDDVHTVPWPSGFGGSRLFSLRADCLREVLSGPIFRVDDLPMSYDGEEMRVCHDQTLLMGFIMASRNVPCGDNVKCTLEALERAMSSSLSEFGIPIPYVDVERTLWRLTNGVLRFDEYGFDGPLLSYADARRAPEYFEYAFNPAFANFYYPLLPHLFRHGGKAA